MNKFIIILFIVSACAVNTVVESSSANNLSKVEETDWRQLSIREKIAQMIMVRVRGDYYHNSHWYRESLQRWLEKEGVGGIISFGGSIHGTYYNIKKFQDWAKYPLLVSADYERGLGQWMNGATLFPTNMALAATANPSYAYEQGKVTAIEAKALGVHITFAPVLDINNNPNNPIINFRSYSNDPKTVTQFGLEFIRGVNNNGLVACVKHFPGHGNTDIDSHSSLPVIKGSKNKLIDLELFPFNAAINAEVEMVMVGHIALLDVDDSGRPASHSSKITTELLREEMGFDGIIISDGMEMGGLTKSAWAGESAVRAVEAGVDILLLPIDVDQTIDAIENALKNGRITENRINRSVEKIWYLKNKMNLFDNIPFQIPFSELEKKIGIPEHSKIATEIANKSITIVKDENKILPLRPENIDSLLHIILSLDENARSYLKAFSLDIQRTHGHVKELFINNTLTDLGRQDIINQLKGVDQVVISLVVRIRMDKGIATIDSTHSLLLEELQNTGTPIVTLSFGSPYLPNYDILETYVCTYGYGSITMKAAANALFGRIPVNGLLPIDLNETLIKNTGIKKDLRSSVLKFDVPTDIKPINSFTNAFAVLDSAIENKIFPGAQVAIVKENKVLFSGGFGYHTYDSSSPPVNSGTIYDIASITKVLCSVPITMKLIAQKKISVDQKVKQFFPAFNEGGKEKVTIRHLLTHSSGLKGYVPFYLDDNINSKDDILNYIINSDLENKPGLNFIYSDLGYILLTAILEKVSGTSFDVLADSWIFKSLDMENTQYNPSYESKNNIAPTEMDTIYRGRLIHAEVHDENTYIMGGISGHAGIFSNAEDIIKFAQTWIDNGLWRSKRIFSESQILEFKMKQQLPVGSDYALGWDTPSKNGKSIAGDYFTSGSIGHLGFTGTSLWIDPDQEIVIVLLTNRVFPSRKDKVGSKEMYGIRREFYNKVMLEISNGI